MGDEVIVVAVVECGDASGALRFDGLRKYRFRRSDLLISGASTGTDKPDGGADEEAPVSKRKLSYTGRQLRDAIVRRTLRDCGCESVFGVHNVLSGETTESVNVEAYDCQCDEFVSLLREDTRDTDVAHRFGSRLRSVIHGIDFAVRRAERESVGSESEGRSDKLSNDLLAIQGRFFPYNPDGIDYAGRRLVVKEVPNNQSDETGLNVWDGSLLLAKYLEACPDKVRSKRVLELGSGCGLVGIAAGMLGAKEVVLTDLQYTLPLMEENVDINADSVFDAGCRRIECLPLDWHTPPPMKDLFPTVEPICSLNERSLGPDSVLIADCVWLEELVAPLLRTVEHILNESSSHLVVYISYQRRGKAAHESFWTGIHSLFRSVKHVDPEAFGLPTSDVLYLFECVA